MALFRRKPPPPPAGDGASLTFDNTGGDGFATWAAEQAHGGDWRAIHERCEAIADPEHRFLVASAIGEAASFPAGWVESTSGAQFPLMARGSFLINEAWRVRGSGRAHEVAEPNWDPFHETLTRAHQDLRQAAELQPTDPGPWARMLTAGMGLSAPKETLLSWYNEAIARSPEFYPAYLLVISPVSEKWGGSHKLMFDVARSSLAQPAGSLAPIAVVRAHMERRLYYAAFEKDDAAAQAYYKDPEVAAELEYAARHSVLSPNRRRTAHTRHALSHFAFALAMIGDLDRVNRTLAAGLFDELGDKGIPGSPWTIRFSANAAGREYMRIRQLCRTSG